MIISMVVAHGLKNQIGYKNKLLWHIPEDLKKFKKITLGHTMVMGRKTFDSIGRVLPGRETWILSGDKRLQIPGTHIFHSKEEILKQACEKKIPELFIVGGEMIYKLFLPETKRIYLTTVDYAGEADAYFPELDLQWEVVQAPELLSPEHELKARFSILERKA
jgi:dihydrofolate reductase